MTYFSEFIGASLCFFFPGRTKVFLHIVFFGKFVLDNVHSCIPRARYIGLNDKKLIVSWISFTKTHIPFFISFVVEGGF